MIKPPLKTSILKITLTKHHHKKVSIAHISMDVDSSADERSFSEKLISIYSRNGRVWVTTRPHPPEFADNILDKSPQGYIGSCIRHL